MKNENIENRIYRKNDCMNDAMPQNALTQVDSARDVRRARRSFDESCSEFAKRFGVEAKTVIAWEHSKANVPINVAQFTRNRLESQCGEPDEDGCVATHDSLQCAYERRDITQARLSLKEMRGDFAKRFGLTEKSVIEWEILGAEPPTNVVLFAQERLKKFHGIVDNLPREERKRLMKIDIVVESI